MPEPIPGPSPEQSSSEYVDPVFPEQPDQVEVILPEELAVLKQYESYTGVCDVISADEARAMADELREHRKNPNRKVMIGVMTHPIVLDLDRPVPEDVRKGISEVFPTREQIALGFTDDPDVLNTIHYADLYGPEGPWKSGQSPDIFKHLEMCVEYGGENLHAIQLDVTWPNVDDIKAFKEKHPDILIVLQVGVFSFREANNDPRQVLENIHQYGDSIDYVLLDTSMGKGKGMDSENLLEMLRLLQSDMPDLGLAVAGGLGPDSLDILQPIADEFPDIAIDAQGRLKPEDSPRDQEGHLVATIPADLDRAKQYISKSCEMLDHKR